MNIGQILTYSGLLIEYIVFQIIPLYYLLLIFSKNRKEFTTEEQMFIPILMVAFMIPLFGAIFGMIVVEEEDNKWIQRFAILGVYFVIIGFIFLVI